jgi:hypothetical protein
MAKGPSIAEQMQNYRPADAVVADVIQRTWAAISESKVASSLQELHFYVINPAVASPALRRSRYFTDSLQALRDAMTIVVNEEFLTEVEIAVRSFALSQSLTGTQYLRSDEQFLGLVKRVEADRRKVLERLRRHPQDAGVGLEPEESIRQELAMVTLFFVSHELGHLLGGHPEGEFSSFVDPRAPLEDRIDAAVVKLCRHVDEFSRHKFGLPGFRRTEQEKSGVRRVAKRYEALDAARHQREEVFFQNEVAADEWANRIMREYLESRGRADEMEGERSLYLLIRGICAGSLWAWYRDLTVFTRKLNNDYLPTADELAVLMMQTREQYIHAASLFGDRHRFTLLRAALAMEALLRARTSWFDVPPEKRSIRSKHDGATIATDQEARREWWLSQSLQRYFLFCIAMDTAVKIAYIGCSTGWIKEKDAKRGTPQLFLMNFESIDQSMTRLSEFA